MKLFKRSVTLTVWLIAATLLYQYVWTHNAAYFPTYPNWVAQWIEDLYELHGDDTERFYDAFWLTISFLNVLAITLAGLLVWYALRYVTNRRRRHAARSDDERPRLR
ncbi:hypothetical protein [Burkholderia ambifaria]|uniref:hypothetical protein n=1 Tax=Burkholderia ambifaria TaxID=152480 RepID=UPI00158D2F70|nr:hypothetical protein [Burkholderia ambifaria]